LPLVGSVKSVLQVGLAFDHVGENGRGRVLEIGHEDLGAGIERIDDHLAIDRTGDLDPAVEKVVRDLGDGPVAFSYGLCLGEKIGQLAGVEIFLAPHAPRQQIQAPSIETPMQPGDERERLGAQNFVVPTRGLGVDLDAGYGRVRCHEGLRKGVGRSEMHVLDLFSAFVEARRRSGREMRPLADRALAPSPSPHKQTRRIGVQRQRRRVVDVGASETDVAQLKFRHPRQLIHRSARFAHSRRPGEDAPQSLRGAGFHIGRNHVRLHLKRQFPVRREACAGGSRSISGWLSRDTYLYGGRH